MGRPAKTLAERLRPKIQWGAPDECWPWLGAISDQGYGYVNHLGRQTTAHRLVHEWLIGPIPDGHQVDHICHNEDLSCPGGKECLHRRCMNPEHFEAVTPLVNTMRGNTPAAKNAAKTHCPQGHAYEGANVAVYNGKRMCLTCKDDRQRARRARLA